MALHKPEHKQVTYWLYYPVLALCYLICLPYAIMVGRHDEPKGDGTIRKWNLEFFRKLEDYIDDPVDWLKHKLFNIGSLP